MFSAPHCRHGIDVRRRSPLCDRTNPISVTGSDGSPPPASFPDARSSLTELITYQNTLPSLSRRFILPCPAPHVLHYAPPPPLSPTHVFRDPETPRSRHGPLSAPQHARHPACLPRQHPHRCHVRQPPLRRRSLPLFRLVTLIPVRRRSIASSRVAPPTLSAASAKRSQTTSISPRHTHHGAIGRHLFLPPSPSRSHPSAQFACHLSSSHSCY